MCKSQFDSAVLDTMSLFVALDKIVCVGFHDSCQYAENSSRQLYLNKIWRWAMKNITTVVVILPIIPYETKVLI